MLFLNDVTVIGSILERQVLYALICSCVLNEHDHSVQADMAVRSTDKQQSHDLALPDELAAAAQAKICQTPLEATISEYVLPVGLSCGCIQPQPHPCEVKIKIFHWEAEKSDLEVIDMATRTQLCAWQFALCIVQLCT